MKEAASEFMLYPFEDPRSGKSEDLTEESSLRKDGEKAADTARQLENDDSNEMNNAGPIDNPDGDDAAENRVWTSLSDD